MFCFFHIPIRIILGIETSTVENDLCVDGIGIIAIVMNDLTGHSVGHRTFIIH